MADPYNIPNTIEKDYAVAASTLYQFIGLCLRSAYGTDLVLTADEIADFGEVKVVLVDTSNFTDSDDIVAAHTPANWTIKSDAKQLAIAQAERYWLELSESESNLVGGFEPGAINENAKNIVRASITMSTRDDADDYSTVNAAPTINSITNNVTNLDVDMDNPGIGTEYIIMLDWVLVDRGPGVNDTDPNLVINVPYNSEAELQLVFVDQFGGWTLAARQNP